MTKESVKKETKEEKPLTKNITDTTAVVGQGILRGSQIAANGAVAAAKGAKEGIQKGVSGFRKFLTYSAEKLHLKNPDLEALNQFEKEIAPHLPTELARRWLWKNMKLKPVSTKGNLVLNWTRVFCWRDDPFKDELLYPIDEFVIVDKEKQNALNRFLVKGEAFGTITGPEGSGKTAFLHWLHWELESHHPDVVPCLIDCSGKKVSDVSLIKQLMLPFLNLYQKTVSRPFEEMGPAELAAYIKSKVREKPFVLLIDEPYNISEKGLAVLEELQKTGITFQLIVAGEKEALKKTVIGKGLKDTLKFELDGLSAELIVVLLQKRIEAVGGTGIYPFDHQMIKILYTQTKGIPASVLHHAKEKVIQLSIERKEEIIAEQIAMEKARIAALQKKAEEERRKRIEERDSVRRHREEERGMRIAEVEKKKKEEQKKYLEELEKEEQKSEKIDEVIGAIIEKEEPEKKKEKDEVKKQDETVKEAIGDAPVPKHMKQAFADDPGLAKELEQVFAETEKARKSDKKKR